MNNEKSGKLDRFFAGKGFYIVLALCVIVIAVSAYSLAVGSDTASDLGLDAGLSAANPTQAAEPSGEPEVNTEPPQEAAVDEKDIVAAGTLTQGEVWQAEDVWRMPVSGEIERGYTVEALAYDVTMADWRTHAGIDISAPLGEVVVAAAGGTVENVYDDDLYGTTVVISLGDGVKTVYSNLAGTPVVSVGDTVASGDVIGSVGDTALCEIGQSSHVHFAVTKDGEAVDPMTYLPV